MNDDDAATLIATYIEADRQKLFQNSCPNRATLLPEIRFSNEDAPIRPATADPARQQRIVPCGDGSSGNLEQRRIVRYEIAAELNETSKPKRINKDCSSDGCPGVFYSCNLTRCVGTTSAPASGASYVASYGRSQFIGATLVSELIGAYGEFSTSERTVLGMGQNSLADLQAARDRGAKLLTWFNGRIGAASTYADAASAWDKLAPAQRDLFAAETGLSEQEYEDIVRLKTSPPTNSNGANLLGDARQAMVTAAIMSDVRMRTLLMNIFRDFDRFTVVGQGLMRNNLRRVTAAFPAAGEEEIAARVARLHNGGNWRAPMSVLTGVGDSYNYVQRFIGMLPGEGEWRSLRCTESFGATVTTLGPGTNGQGVGGIQLDALKLD